MSNRSPGGVATSPGGACVGPSLLLPGLVQPRRGGGAGGKGCWRKRHPPPFTLPVSHRLRFVSALPALKRRGSVRALPAVSLPVGGSPGIKGPQLMMPPLSS